MARLLPNNLKFTSPHDINSFLNTTFGQSTVHRLLHGTTHVTLLHHNTAANTYHTIKTSHRSPKHTFDTFMLNVCRAASDAIVITGETIRTEPTLTMNLFGSYKSVLQQWRTDVINKSQQPDIIVLTRNKDSIDATHPLLHTSHNVIYHTPASNTADGLTALLRHFDDRYTAVSIEAGPNTTSPVYRQMLQGNVHAGIDTLFLSTYSGTLPSPDMVETSAYSDLQLTPSVIQQIYPLGQCVDASDRTWQFCVRHR